MLDNMVGAYRLSPGQALNPHRLCTPSSNGYQMERTLVLRMAIAAENARHSPQGDETVKELVPTPEGKVKSAVPKGDIWAINTYTF